MRSFHKILIFMLAAALLMCGTAFAGEYPDIVCTSFPCYDFARAVTGDKAHLSLLIKPGAEVHSYDPTPADIMSIADCDLFIYIGGESDAWVEDILSGFGDDAPETLRLFDCVEALEEVHAQKDAPENEHAHEYDEHIWTSPVNAQRMVRAIADKLTADFSNYSDAWKANADAYTDEIGQIDAQFRDIVAQGARRVMVFADRFPFLYFANEYGIEWVAAFDSCASESEPSAKTVVSLIERVKVEAIPVVYMLEMSNGKIAETISEETGAEIRTFHSIQNVTEAEFSGGETYVSLMKKNVEALKEGIA